jgi:MSHA biogenesis protein MshK
VFKRNYAIVLLFSAMLCSAALLAAQSQDKPTAPGTLLDPMRPPNAEAEGKSAGKKRADADGFQLSAIRITREQRSAIVNGKTVRVGEHLGSARITAIQANSITLQQGGKTVTVSLLPLSIKKPVEAPQP